MLNRKIGPVSHTIHSLVIPDIEVFSWSNGTKVCVVNQGSQDIAKIEIIHKAGRTVEDHRLASRAVSSLLKDGCGHKSSAQVSEEIDYYGASIKTASNLDFSFTSLHTLTKHAESLLPLVYEMYESPLFLDDELAKFKKLNIQKLKEELTKNEVITYRQITEEIFGKDHAYGYNSTEDDYEQLDRSILLQHYRNYYGTDNCFVFVSGKITNTMMSSLEDYFGKDQKTTIKKEYSPVNVDVNNKKYHLKSANEHQSAIKTGMRLFTKNHPDHTAFFMLNTIFGGYFGSRLMSSIREDLGYTYDIYSSVDQMVYDGCFYVSTEAAPEYETPILNEIYRQMDILKQDLVPKSELKMVKNYLMGNFMNMLDGPMNLASFAKSMILTGKLPSDLPTLVSEINVMTSEKIMQTAQKYFDESKMIEVVVSPI